MPGGDPAGASEDGAPALPLVEGGQGRDGEDLVVECKALVAVGLGVTVAIFGILVAIKLGTGWSPWGDR